MERMMSDEEIYSPEELRAFHVVGEFLGWFARLEAVIDYSIIDILELEQVAGRLLMTFVTFSNKCSILEELATSESAGLSEAERRDFRSAIGKIRDLSQKRNTIAHSMFEPIDGGIKFSHGKKKLVEDRSETINHDVFPRYRTQMADLWGSVASIASKIRFNGGQKQIAEAVLRARLAIVEPEPGSKPN
jgi:hypothetical protein